MKIQQVWIERFKNLVDFTADFDTESLTSVIVGRNGTGKSNLLEALIIIFRDLDLGVPPAFQYSIKYWCHEKLVEIDADPGRKTRRVQVTIDGQALPYSRLVRRDPDEVRYLPKNVFGYYSGTSNRMESHFEAHQKRFYEDLLKGEGGSLRPLLYARLVHSQFALLAFFGEQDDGMLTFLREHLRINELDSVLFVMQQPPWASKQGDPRFWNARGTVGKFLASLYANALAPLRGPARVNLGFRTNRTLERLHLYLPSIEELRAISSGYDTQQDFFKALESTYLSELISEVRVLVKVRNVDGSLVFRDMSEGEQQLLMVLGLLRFTNEEEVLFLLDEPDTHLNPAWGMQYVDFLSQVVGNHDSSQILMATHNPLVIAGLEREQVQIMQRDDESGRTFAEHPERAPRGMGVGALLTSDVYGLRSQLDTYTLERLDEQRKLAIKPTLTDIERKQLAELNDKLHDLDLTTSVRDPLYKLFVEAMTVKEETANLEVPVLSERQREQRQKLAREVMAELQSEEDGDH